MQLHVAVAPARRHLLLGVAQLVPAYFDELIDAYHRGATARSVHLGVWRDDHDPGDFAGAQARLDELMIDLAALRAGQSVLDAGCGFGGTLARINAAYQKMRLVGINIDDRQLAICRGVASRAENALAWHLADACRLPFAGASFDRVLCVEAMFHFASRRRFFGEAARVLRPEGVLAGTDILIAPQARPAALPTLPLDAILQAGFGPWPDVWGDDADHAGLAHAAGLSGEVHDITAEVGPSFRHTAPPDADPADTRAPAAMRASAALRWLHDRGWLRYVSFRFERTPAAASR
jgi:ubiquinone/menaquinone biosynthesis C-methylase UbiE